MNLLLEPGPWLVVICFSGLFVIPNLAAYELGEEGVEAVMSRFPKIYPEQLQRAGDQFQKWGAWILLLSGIPGWGLLLTTAAGVFGVKKKNFYLLFFLGV